MHEMNQIRMTIELAGNWKAKDSIQIATQGD